MLDKIKPSFRLRNYIVRRVIIKQYPVVALRPRLYMIALHWFKEEVQAAHQFGLPLSGKIVQKFLDFRASPKRNNLVKKRAEYTKRIIAGQFNIRYT